MGKVLETSFSKTCAYSEMLRVNKVWKNRINSLEQIVTYNRSTEINEKRWCNYLNKWKKEKKPVKVPQSEKGEKKIKNLVVFQASASHY